MGDIRDADRASVLPDHQHLLWLGGPGWLHLIVLWPAGTRRRKDRFSAVGRGSQTSTEVHSIRSARTPEIVGCKRGEGSSLFIVGDEGVPVEGLVA